MKKSLAIIIAVLSFLVGIGVGHMLSPLFTKVFAFNKKYDFYSEYDDEDSEMNLGGNLRYEEN